MRYGTGIFEKYPGVWYARWAIGKHRHVQKAGTKAQAINLYRRRKDEVLQGRNFPENLRKGVKFADIVADAIAHARRLGRPPGNLRKIRNWFSASDAADITPYDVERELDKLKADGLSPATRNRYKAAVSGTFALAIRNRKAITNPARAFKAERENNARTRYLSGDEEAKVRNAIRERWPKREPEFDLALHTGLRKGEQYSLRWADVDLIEKILTVVKAKGNKRRHVPLNENARAAFAQLKQRANGSAFVCPGGMGNDGYHAIRYWFDQALAAAGVNDFTWHDLRHTFASRLRMKGVALENIKDLLGHTTLNMVLRYAHLEPEYLRKAVDAIATPREPVQAQPEKVALQ